MREHACIHSHIEILCIYMCRYICHASAFLGIYVILASLDMLLNPLLNGWLKSRGELLSNNPLAAEEQECPGYYQKRA